MKELYLTNKEDWREWLSQNHATETEVWLIFYKKRTSRPAIEYENAVEEAICFGWIDSIIKKIDASKYARKFTPRKDKSQWSQLNKKRASKMINQGRMTNAGLVKIQKAKTTGLWDLDPTPRISPEIPSELRKALSLNNKARENFDKLAPSYRKQYIGWITVAKKQETKKRRIAEAIALLEQNKKLGLK